MALTDGSVRSKLAELWLPMIGGILAVKAIGIADAYFVGQLGEGPLAAISFTFPIVSTLISLAIGLSAGASSVLSRKIGENAGKDEQRAIVTGAVGMAIFIAAILAGIGFLSIGVILDLMGASDAVRGDALSYMQIWFAGSIFLIVPIAINGLLRSTGDGVSPAILMTVIAILNIGLNPVFIFGFGVVPELGVQGAAVATVLARAVSMVAALVLIIKKDLFAFSLQQFLDGLSYWREVARVGLPASLSTSLNPVAISIATAAVATLGESQVAAFGVATKIQSFALVPLLALSASTSPFVGQNSGAGETERSRRGLWLCAAISAVWSLLIAVPLWLGADTLTSFFSESTDVRDSVGLYLAIVPLSFAGYGVIVALGAAMNGLGRSGTSLLLGGGRALLLLAPLAWIGVIVDDFRGLAFGVAAANVVAGICGIIVIAKHSLTTRDGGHDKQIESSECD